MKMFPLQKHGAILVALFLGLIGSASAASYTLNLKAEAAVGKYTAQALGDLSSVMANYDVKATSGSDRFWTFCLESEVYFQSDRVYNAAKATSTDSPSGADTISVSTAYLYEQFAKGDLASFITGFTYDVAGGARLQRMIWWLEDEQAGVKDDVIWSLLETKFGSGAQALQDYTGTSVSVLNLTKYNGAGGDELDSSYGTLRQDQLVYWGSPTPKPTNITTSVPDGGTSVGLLGLALMGVAAVRRFIAGR